MINSIRRIPKFVGIFLLTFLIYIPFSRLGVDPHHDGIMLIPALVVARGGVIHRDAYSLYGPITAYFQALFVWLLGPYLLSIRIATVTYLSLAIALLQRSWSRVYGEGVGLLAYVLAISSTYFLIENSGMHPWSSDVMLLLQSLTLYLLVVAHSNQQRWNKPLIYSAGFVLGMQFANRYTSALLMLIGLSVYFLIYRRSSLRFLILGVVSSVGLIFSLLVVSGSYGDWYFQSIYVARHWVSDVSGSGGWAAIRVAVASEALPGAAIVLVAIFAFKAISTRTISHTQRALVALYVSLLVVAASQQFTVPYWSTSNILWTFVGLLLIATPWYFWQLLTDSSGSIASEMILFIGAIAASAAIFPIADIRHLFWGLLPAIGPCLMFLKAHIKPRRNQLILAVLAVLLIVPSTLGSIAVTLDADRISVPNTPVLKGMLMDRQYSGFFVDRFAMVNDFLNVHPNTTILNICTDGLFASLSPALRFADPFFISWSFERDFFSLETPEGRKRFEFVQNERPIVWMCPTSEDPLLIAERYNLRLIPVNPNVDTDAPFDRWPYVSYLGVPKEWPQIDLELSQPRK
jgi:hypothetical protein